MNKKNIRNYRDSDFSGEQNTKVLDYDYIHVEKRKLVKIIVGRA